MIRQQVQAFVSNGNLKTPDANRLFVVYVEPGVAIMNDHDQNSTSIKDFLGYHGAFAGRDRLGYAADIHYAVIAYPGGYNFTSQRNGLPSDFAQLTEVTSHELAEAVTDPNVNYKTLGWYDPQRGEIGDIVNLQTFTMNGYVVQKESDRFDRAITPSSYGLATTAVTSMTPNSQFSAASSSLWNQITVGPSSAHEQGLAHLLFDESLVGQLTDGNLVKRKVAHHSPAVTAGGIHIGALDQLFGLAGGIV
jgi:hypothetical protein